jgi:hypothetical protein
MGLSPSLPPFLLLDSDNELRLLESPAHEGIEGVSAGGRRFGRLHVNDYDGCLVGSKMSQRGPLGAEVAKLFVNVTSRLTSSRARRVMPPSGLAP